MSNELKPCPEPAGWQVQPRRGEFGPVLYATKEAAQYGQPYPPRALYPAEVVSFLSAEVKRLTAERDAAVMQVSREAAARGQAEGRLEASEMAGVVAGWRERAEAAEAERDSLKEKLGLLRVCVNCWRTADASKVKRGDDLPECVGPDGLSGCTFDLTPQEAWEHWRSVAHDRREDAARMTTERDAALARVREMEQALKWYGEQAAGCRKLSQAGDQFRHALDRDGGARARALLNREEGNA
jgi:hypothetical protein